jgi:carboxypeptidase A2
MKALTIFLIGLCLAAVSEGRKSYEGYKVLKVVPKNPFQLEFLRHKLVSDDHLDFWTEPSRLGQEVDIMVGPAYLADFQQQLTEASIQINYFIDNVQDTLAPELERLASRNTPDQHVFNINDFNTLADINAWLQSWTTSCAAGLICEVYNAGNSFEGNPINVLKISKAGTGRLAFWVDSTIHAREWLAPATALQIVNQLTTQADADAISLTDRYDWYFMIVQNPDGYLFTWSDDRLWRKNRRPNAGSACVGTDLNRNFDFRWGNEGVSHSACSDTYCGPTGGSEPETQATQNEFNRLASTLVAITTIHAYGNMWMFPWGNTINYNGFTCERTADYDELMRVAMITANAIENTWNTQWARGTSCEVIYATTGGTDDYAKGVSGIKYAWCPELRGNGFVISAEQIPLSFREIYNGIVAMVNAIAA